MSIPMKIVGGFDTGNGRMKDLVRGGSGILDEVDILSMVKIVNRPNAMPIPDEEAPEEIAKGLYDRLDASFATPLVSDTYRRLFGKRAVSASGALDVFDVNGRLSKAEQPLGKVLVLGVIAAKALTDYVTANGKLPQDMIDVDARVALALPITEFMVHRSAFAHSFKANTHTVTIHNFVTPVTVRISFSEVKVYAEGSTAQVAINDKGTVLMNAMLANARKRGLTLEGVTAEHVLSAKNTIGIDIGEGTVNFPVFSADDDVAQPDVKMMKFNPDVSTTLPKGYGNVLEDAAEVMRQQRVADFNSRGQLSTFLAEGPSPTNPAGYSKVKMHVDNEIEFFCEEIARQLGVVMGTVGALTNVIYVYGGGAGAMEDKLYPILINKANEMGGVSAPPVLYLDSGYSRFLNREGLYLAADRLDQVTSAPAKKKGR